MLSNELDTDPNLNRISGFLSAEICARLIENAQNLDTRFVRKGLDLIFSACHMYRYIAI